MPDGKHKPGYKLPEVIDPDTCCVCIPLPNDFNHKMAFLGQLDELGYWWNWERDDDKKGREAAAVWRNIVQCIREDLDMSGCGCGGDKPTNTRINPETGLYEVSYDGGITWEPDPGSDPRSSGTTFPPLPGDPGTALRCEGSNSVVGFFQSIQQQEFEGLEANASVADLITGLIGALSGIGFIFAFVPAAIVALLAFVVNKFAHLIAEDFNAEFTEATWDELLCVVYCAMSPDGSFSEAAWQEIKALVITEVGGYAGYWLSDHINLIGTVGLTNAARAGYPGTRDCEGCNCNPECADESWIVNGTIVDSGDGWIEILAGADTYGSRPGFWISYGAPPPFTVGEYCCMLCDIEVTAGTIDGAARRLCDGTVEAFAPVTGVPYLLMEWRMTDATGTIRLTFDGAPDCP